MTTIGAYRMSTAVDRIEAESVLPLAPAGIAVASGVVECVARRRYRRRRPRASARARVHACKRSAGRCPVARRRPSPTTAPPPSSPAAYASAHFHGYDGDTTGAEHGLKFAKGTTTLAFKFQGGVIVSVDSRSTQGAYIGARGSRAPRTRPSARRPLTAPPRPAPPHSTPPHFSVPVGEEDH